MCLGRRLLSQSGGRVDQNVSEVSLVEVRSRASGEAEEVVTAESVLFVVK